jgi:hypothetical protein
MKCILFGCVTHVKCPISGQVTWYNYCPNCHSRLDR